MEEFWDQHEIIMSNEGVKRQGNNVQTYNT